MHICSTKLQAALSNFISVFKFVKKDYIFMTPFVFEARNAPKQIN